MASFYPINGLVTSWAGTQNTNLISTGNEPMSFTLDSDALEFDTTALSAAGIATFLKGLSQWRVTMRSRLKTAQTGDLGLVTHAGGYATNINRWDMAVEVAAFENTVFGATSRSYLPGKLSWGGTFSGFMDDTTVITMPGNGNEPATGTFKLREAGATDDTLSGSIFTTRLGVEISPENIAVASYGYRGSGTLTNSTPSAGTTVFGTGAVARPTIGELVLTADTGYTLTGNAFWVAARIVMEVNGLSTVELEVQGTGALAIANV